MKAATCLAAVALALSVSTAQGQLLEPASVLTRKIEVERAEPTTSIPVEVRAGKLFVEARVNGQSANFIFDTGSPTILSRSLADKLKLKTVARNTGVDAHGTPVAMDIAVLDSLSIGGVTFHGVPVLIFDFSKLPLGPCFIDGGTIGSEIFPGSSWTIDLQKGRIAVSAPAGTGKSETAAAAKLHDFGYPHAPVFDYSIGSLTDKALFDTGNSEQLTLFRKLLDDPNVLSAIVAGSRRDGRGSEGESAGGRGAVTDLSRFGLTGLQVGEMAFPPLAATTRDAPPTLLGAGLLGSYVVTLDYPAGRILFEPRTAPALRKPHGGYAIAMVGDHAEVVQLFEGSPATKAGLKLGDTVVAIGAKSLDSPPPGQLCESAKWLAQSFDSSKAADIAVLRDGNRITIAVPASPEPAR